MKRQIAVILLALVALTFAQNYNEPNWEMRVISWNFNTAYPGLTYDYRLGVIGGTYPYKYELAAGPNGMALDENTGAILWDAPASPSAGNQVSIRITDSKGQAITHNYAIDVTTAGFYFVSKQGGSDANDGSLNNPWQTLDKAQTTLQKGDIIYFREGTYVAHRVDIKGSDPRVWLGYPGEKAIIDGEFSGIIAPGYDGWQITLQDGTADGNYMFQNLEFTNCGYWTFMCWSIKGAIFRKNVMHDIHTSGGENPAFIFTSGSNPNTPGPGNLPKDRIVIQENEMYELRNTNNHAAGVVTFGAAHVLFEDNHVHHVDGNGFNDKDDGYYNTVRNNVIHDVRSGILLLNQGTEQNTDVSHNLIYNTNKVEGDHSGIIIGFQPGYLHDVFVHHNTLIECDIYLRWVIEQEQSDNWNVYHNLIYSTSAYGITYERGEVHQEMIGPKFKSDNNLFWNNGAGTELVVGPKWGGRTGYYDLAGWQAMGQDEHSVYADPQLDAGCNLPKGSPFYGIYGRDIGFNTADIAVPNTNVCVSFVTNQRARPMIYDIFGKRVPATLRQVKSANAIHFKTSSAGQGMAEMLVR